MLNILLLADSEDDTVVVLQDYPAPEISEPIYRMGEKLKVLAQYDHALSSTLKMFQFSDSDTHLVDKSSQTIMRKLTNKKKGSLDVLSLQYREVLRQTGSC